MSRIYATLPHEYLEEMEELSDAEFGRLMRALLQYSRDGQAAELRGNERFYWRRVTMQEDRFQASYDGLREVRREAGKKGGQKQKADQQTPAEAKETKESKPKQTEANPSKAKQAEAKESKAKQAEAKSSKRTYTETETNTNTKTNLSLLPTVTRACAAAEPDQMDADFSALWDAYPRKVGKKAARQIFERLWGHVDLAVLLHALELHKQSAQWQRSSGRYVPNLANWLEGERWEDVLSMPPDATHPQPIPAQASRAAAESDMEYMRALLARERLEEGEDKVGHG